MTAGTWIDCKHKVIRKLSNEVKDNKLHELVQCMQCLKIYKRTSKIKNISKETDHTLNFKLKRKFK